MLVIKNASKKYVSREHLCLRRHHRVTLHHLLHHWVCHHALKHCRVLKCGRTCSYLAFHRVIHQTYSVFVRVWLVCFQLRFKFNSCSFPLVKTFQALADGIRVKLSMSSESWKPSASRHSIPPFTVPNNLRSRPRLQNYVSNLYGK